MRKAYHSGSFREVWGFMGEAVLLREKMNHHREWFNVGNRVQLILTTHDLEGVSALDSALVRAVDKIAPERDRRQGVCWIRESSPAVLRRSGEPGASQDLTRRSRLKVGRVCASFDTRSPFAACEVPHVVSGPLSHDSLARCRALHGYGAASVRALRRPDRMASWRGWRRRRWRGRGRR